MSKKSFTAFILLLLVVIGGAYWYFFMRDGGEPTQPGQGTDSGDDLFPFGQGPAGSGQGTTTPGVDTTIDLSGGASGAVPRLRKVWDEPTAGAVLVASGTSAVSVRFVDRATGHIYETLVDSTAETKLSNVTIPQIYEALWSASGKEVILRYLKDDSIQSFYAAVSTSTDIAAALEGYFLTPNIREIAVLGSKSLYLNPTASNGSFVIATMSGTGKASILGSEFKEWLISWNNPSLAFVSSKPSAVARGFGYLLNTGTGTTTKIADGILGLTGNISPRGDYVLLSAYEDGGVATAAYNVATKAMTVLPIATLSDKCAWSNVDKAVVYCAVPGAFPRGLYPDDWYLGSVSLSDKLWKIDVSTGETDMLIDPLFDAVEEMDMFKLTVGAGDSHIAFTNKKDMSLWLYDLK